MTQLRFDIPVPADTDPAVVEQFAQELSEELGKASGVGPVIVEPLGPDRSLAAVGTAIAVALPLILDGIKATDGLLGVVEKLRKLARKKDDAPAPQKALLAALDPKDILVRVGRGYIPLSELTLEDLQGRQPA